MDLLLWRHADAENAWPDEERALTKRGLSQAHLVAQWIKSHIPIDARILVSPAKRTQQTAQALQLPFTTDPNLAPRATASEVLKAAQWPHSTGTTLIVGHQPTLGEIISLLLTDTLSEWDVPKASVWWFKQPTPGSKIIFAGMVTPDLLSSG